MKKTIAIVSVLVVVFLCSSPVFATSSGVANSFRNSYTLYTQSGYSDIYAHIQLTSFRPYTESYNSSSGLITEQFVVLGKILLINDNNIPVRIKINNSNQMFFNIQVAVNANGNIPWSVTDVQFLGGTLNPAYINGNRFYFERYHLDLDGGNEYLVIPANGQLIGYYQIIYSANMSTLTGLITPQFTSSSVVSENTNVEVEWNYDNHYNYQSYIPDIYDALVDSYDRLGVIDSHIIAILNAYNSNVPIAQDSTQSAQQSQSDANVQHQQELSIYQNTNQAISGTGLNNYQFNNEQIGGIGGVSNDFTNVFNSLGSWNNVYIFSLTLSLALAIIRHIRPSKRQNE